MLCGMDSSDWLISGHTYVCVLSVPLCSPETTKRNNSGTKRSDN